MVKTSQPKLTMDRPETYEIQVPGEIDEGWVDWADRMTIRVISEGDEIPVTILTGTIDQAALHGLLRRLYSLSLPLISVHWVESGSKGEKMIPYNASEGKRKRDPAVLGSPPS
jgi:hypothetical protein